MSSHLRTRSERWLTLGIGLALVSGLVLGIQKARRQPSPQELIETFHARLASERGTVSPAFRDVTLDFGIVSTHDNDQRGRYYLPEEMGPGVGVFDLDDDGDLDILVAGGGPLLGGRAPQTCELWRNDGGRFTEAAQALGAAVPGPCYGVACGDADGDGDVDVYLTRLGADVYLRNEGGRFVDATEAAGLGSTGFGTSAAFFDFDRDGALDLYVAQYVEWSPERERECFMAGVRDYCDPTTYASPAADRLYRNDGSGHFQDVTESAGIATERGNGLGVLAGDFDADGWADLYVANDSSPAFLWRNGGDGTFEEAALELGCAYDSSGVAIAGMGVASADLDADGRFDLLVTNIHGQSHLALLQSERGFVDASQRLGFLRWSLPSTGFGVVLFDQDHDGALDVYVTNGAVNLSAARIDAPNPYAEPDQFARLSSGRFVDATLGSGAASVGAGRGLAAGDLDGDGDIDLVVTHNGGALKVLASLAPKERGWILVDVRTRAGAPAIGAQVEAHVAGRIQRAEVRAQSSYLSSCDPRVHFGLGAAQALDELRVTWPDGFERTLSDVPGRQVLEVRRE